MKLIDEWRSAWRFYSTWAFAVLLASPDIYAAAVTFGLLADLPIPPYFVWTIRGVAAAGLVARYVKQSKPDCKR